MNKESCLTVFILGVIIIPSILNGGCIVQERDFQWFLNNYNSIYQAYGRSFVAIKNETVLGSYPSYGEGVRETAKNHPLGTFIVQECNGSESAYSGCIASTNFLVD